MSDVFISYKAEDRTRIAPLVRALETDGISVWWDAHIGGGDDWRQTILRHLEMAKCVLVVWSKRSVGPNGEFVRDEAGRALKRKTYLPVRIDKVASPLGFGEVQALDLSGWKGDTSDPRYGALLESVRRRLGTKSGTAQTVRARPSGVDRRGILAGASVAGLAAVAAGGWYFLRPSAAKSNSIAVLPFENLSGDPNQTYFADGIAEELRSALAQIAGLRVVARTSSEAVRNDDATSAAHKLGVSHILTGSFRRSASTIRVSTQLVDSAGLNQWSQTYDRAPGDALQIQSDIASSVAQALSLQLGNLAENFRRLGETDKPEAQDLILRATGVTTREDSEVALRKALALVNAALAIDPNYGKALTKKARLLQNVGLTYGRSAAESQSYADQAEQSGLKAVTVSPDLPAAHAAVAAINFWDFKFQPALTQLEKVVNSQSSLAEDLDSAGWFFGLLKRFDLALNLLRRAALLDPLNPSVPMHEATVLKWMRDYRNAVTAAARSIGLSSTLWEPRTIQAHCLLRLGKLDEATAAFDDMASRDGPWLVIAAEIADRRGDRTGSNRILARFGPSGPSNSYNYQIAQVLAFQGRQTEAIAALENAWAARDAGLAFLQVDDNLDSLRGDPHFQAIIKRMNFPV